MLMKIGKITTLLCLLAAGTLTSVAQLSWVYEGKTLVEGETITVKGDDLTLYETYIDLENAGGATKVTVTKEIKLDEGFDLNWCCGTNCYPESTAASRLIDIASGLNENFLHAQVASNGAPEGGEAHETFTVAGGGSSATVNVVFVLDNTGGVNDVTGNGKGFGITYANDVLTVSGASAGQQVRVVDITGRVAASMPVDGDGVQRFDLNLGRGIYLVAVQEAGRTVAVQKVIVR